ncbi:MAG TPA: PIG-L deacetylase family protein [Vicinamibacteria bacterium]|nr:PIG-L deacetylase family protein [Vicinamibacteria bacterium]
MTTALAVFAHPDDMEFLAAGTLLRLKAVGHQVHCLAVANGCCGSSTLGREETARVRRGEAEESCRLAGFAWHESLVNDFEVLYEPRTMVRLAALVRQVAPGILLTHSPADYMEDHENACRLAVSAAFGRGMPNLRTEPEAAPIDLPLTVYHAQPHGNRDPLGSVVRPTHYVDVGGEVLERKTAMLACHRSQQQWLDESQGMSSYLQAMRALMREVGEWSSRFQHAEGWRRRLSLGFCAPDADPLASALGPHCLRT